MSACVSLTPATCGEGEEVSLNTLASTNRAILVGEYHGTAEMPAAFVGIADELSADSRKVVIALEFPTDWQATIDEMMVADSSSAAALIWNEKKTADGRTSQSMRTMMLELWRLKQSRPNLVILSVDTNQTETTDDIKRSLETLPENVDPQDALRDILMGERAVDGCLAHSCETLLYYAGNFHTGLNPHQGSTLNTLTGEIRSYPTVPAGFIISNELPTAAIYLVHRGGTAKARTRAGFKARTIKPTAPDYVVNDATLYCTASDKSHTHALSVGTLSSSSDPKQ